MKTIKKIKPGLYQHFKGNRYQVLGTAHHSETLEDMVVYRALYGKKEFWVRPVGMFFEYVKAGGKKVRRFKFLKK